jgi:hypothetical protein
VTREKWFKPTNNFGIGEIFLTIDHQKVNDWRLARVIGIEKGSWNQVRKSALLLLNLMEIISKNMPKIFMKKENVIKLLEPQHMLLLF